MRYLFSNKVDRKVLFFYHMHHVYVNVKKYMMIDRTKRSHINFYDMCFFYLNFVNYFPFCYKSVTITNKMFPPLNF